MAAELFSVSITISENPLRQRNSPFQKMLTSRLNRRSEKRESKPGETHLNFSLDKKENRVKFVMVFIGFVGWVERDSRNNR